jgi:hypothetical protein
VPFYHAGRFVQVFLRLSNCNEIKKYQQTPCVFSIKGYIQYIPIKENKMHTFVPESAVEYFRSGAHKSQRFGQFYINRYMPSDTVWPELFYEKDTKKALELILGIPDENDSQP